MLKLNITHVANLRGITNVFTFLRQLGISHNVANRYTTGEALSVSFRHLTTIAAALNCTPNDLIDYIPSASQPLTTEHPLNTLRKNTQQIDFKQLLKTLPLDKINQIAQILSENKNEAQS